MPRTITLHLHQLPMMVDRARGVMEFRIEEPIEAVLSYQFRGQPDPSKRWSGTEVTYEGDDPGAGVELAPERARELAVQNKLQVPGPKGPTDAT